MSPFLTLPDDPLAGAVLGAAVGFLFAVVVLGVIRAVTRERPTSRGGRVVVVPVSRALTEDDARAVRDAVEAAVRRHPAGRAPAPRGGGHDA